MLNCHFSLLSELRERIDAGLRCLAEFMQAAMWEFERHNALGVDGAALPRHPFGAFKPPRGHGPLAVLAYPSRLDAGRD